MTITKFHIIAVGFVVHVVTAIFSVGYHQCDELFQVFEFAGYKLGINTASEMPWEFAAQMRSGIEPLLVYGVSKLFHSCSIDNPFTIALFLRLLMSLFSFFVITRFLTLCETELNKPAHKLYVWAFGLLFWCLPYFHARLSSENFSSNLFLLALTLILQSRNEKPKLRLLLLAGFLAGIAFVCRFQFVFMMVGLLGWLIVVSKPSFKFYLILFIGLIGALGFGLLVDKWLYGQWVLSWWNYLAQNLFENKASVYGESPVYFYFLEALLQLIPPFSVLIIAAIIGFWIKFRMHYLTWITLPFILLHFFVAHKELRFLFPILNFLPVMVLLFIQALENERSKLESCQSKTDAGNPDRVAVSSQNLGKVNRQSIVNRILIKFCRNTGWVKFAVAINVLLLVFFTFKPADETSQSLEKIYALVEGEKPVLAYLDKNPYNKHASLNYFRNRTIQTLKLDADSLVNLHSKEVYLYVEKFGGDYTIEIGKEKFNKIYSNFPDWFKYLNFNGWLERANCYSIYKIIPNGKNK
jgi:GPI mannosyltransferase 3